MLPAVDVLEPVPVLLEAKAAPPVTDWPLVAPPAMPVLDVSLTLALPETAAPPDTACEPPAPTVRLSACTGSAKASATSAAVPKRKFFIRFCLQLASRTRCVPGGRTIGQRTIDLQALFWRKTPSCDGDHNVPFGTAYLALFLSS